MEACQVRGPKVGFRCVRGLRSCTGSLARSGCFGWVVEWGVPFLESLDMGWLGFVGEWQVHQDDRPREVYLGLERLFVGALVGRSLRVC